MSAPFTPKDYALAFVGLGMAVFPAHTARKTAEGYICNCRFGAVCKAPAKHPVAQFAPRGLKDASKDPAIVRKMFGGFGFRNVAIATGGISGIVVLDVDAKNGGYESLTALEAQHGALPPTLNFNTGGGGKHYVFRHPGSEIRNSAGQLGSGLDVRGDGGYIVAPPSRHISGGLYQLAEGCDLDTPIAPPPAWLLRLMQQSGGNSASLGKPTVANLVRGTLPGGQRNTSITRIVGHLLAKRVDPHICLDLMLAFNEARCNPPLDASEVAGIVASIDHRAFTQLINRP